MFRQAMAEIDVKAGVKTILERMKQAFERRTETICTKKPQLVAVSKTKPVQMIIDAYSVGQRHFGENYVQELFEKGSNKDILEQCKDIRWHFIGHLQRNKISKLISTPGLYMVETVDSEKLATSLDLAWNKVQIPDKEKLKVLVQVNTSSEKEKNGAPPDEVAKLFGFVREKCKNLDVAGIMTIGKFGHDYSMGPNPDFVCLLKCHEDVCTTLGLSPESVEISMGMSDDFENAVEMGSTNVRVGSSLFGHRSKPSN